VPVPGLTDMTRIEIVVGAADRAAVGDTLTACGATGYTVFSGVSGLGHGGYHQGQLAFNDRDGLCMVLAVVPEDRAADAVQSLRAMLDDRPGVLFVSSTAVSRPGYFT